MSLITAIQNLLSPLPEGSVRYKGYVITATPEKAGSAFRIAGSISKKNKQAQFALADRVVEQAACVELTHRKGMLFIDQKGEALFS